MEWQIQFFKVFIYSTIYGSAALLILLLIRKIVGKKIQPRERMCLWWVVIFTFVLTLTIFPKGDFTSSYTYNKYAFPPIHINFKIFGELIKENTFSRTGDIEYSVSAFYNGSWETLCNGNGNLILSVAFFSLLTGMLFYLLSSFIRFIMLKKKVKDFKECDDENIKQYVQQDALFYDIEPPIIKKVPQKFFNEVPCACVMGFLSPILLIISEQWEILSKEQKQAVITHEVYHIKKKDNVLNIFCILLQSLQWFNPLVWIGFKYLRQDLECLRDTQIIEYFTSEEQKNYAKAIVSIAGMNSKKYRTSMHSGMLCSSGIGYRIWLLQSKNTKWSRLGLLITILFILVFLYVILKKETLGLLSSTFVI